MRALKVDPYTNTVKVIDFDGSDHRNMYTELSSDGHEVDCFERVSVGPGVHAWIDESGATERKNPTHYWQLPTTGWIAGMAVILSETDYGGEDGPDWSACHIPVPAIHQFIKFGVKGEIEVPSTEFFVRAFDTPDELLQFLKDRK